MAHAQVTMRTRLRVAWRITHRIAYRIWLVLLAVKVAIVAAALALIAFDWAIQHAHAAEPRDVLQQRQQTLNDILTDETLASVKAHRMPCAGGRQPGMTVTNRKLGAVTLPDAADYCITILTRLGREGALTGLKDASGGAQRPALAFDGGFVAAFATRESLPADAPGMAALKPVAERCLAQSEGNTALCTSAGYIIGLRAVQGENVRVAGL